MMVNNAFEKASIGDYRGIIGYEDQPLVSSDFNTTNEICIFAPRQTRVSGDHLVRVLAWYDNEWAFSCKMADTAAYMMKMEKMDG